MSLLTTLAAFAVTLGVLILVHEFGHYWVARRCGVRVLRFSIGFGRPLLRMVRGPDRTEWVVAAIPLGGYVRMLDERDADQGPVPAQDLARAFNRQPVARRIAIVLAGPVANLLLAVAVYWMLNVVGVEEPRAVLAQPAAQTPAARAGLQQGDQVMRFDGQAVQSWNQLNWHALRAVTDRRQVEVEVARGGADPRLVTLDLQSLEPDDGSSNPVARSGLRLFAGAPKIGKVSPDGAAASAGLAANDRLLAVDGVAVESARGFVDSVRAQPQRRLQLTIERDGVQRTIVLTPASTIDAAGKPVGRIGAEISERAQMTTVRYGLLDGLGLAVERTASTAVFSVQMLGRMLVGEASLANLSGPVTIADYAGRTAAVGLAAYLSFLALISISLGVLNLLPIPMLDGGHLLYYLIEIVKGSPPSEVAIEWGQRAGIAVLVMLTSLALFNDLSRLLS